MKHRALGLLICVACACSTSGEAELSQAKQILDDVREATLDLTYEHAEYRRALDAFERVPERSPERDQAEIWIARLSRANQQDEERKQALAAELLAPPDEFPEFRFSVQQAQGRTAASNASGVVRDPRLDARRTGGRARAADLRVPATADVDNAGRGKGHWQQRRNRLDQRVASLQSRVNTLQNKVRRSCVNAMAGCKSRYKRRSVKQGDLADVTYKPEEIQHNDGKNSRCAQRREQLAEAQQELNEARNEQAGLSDEARRAGALPGWIR